MMIGSGNCFPKAQAGKTQSNDTPFFPVFLNGFVPVVFTSQYIMSPSRSCTISRLAGSYFHLSMSKLFVFPFIPGYPTISHIRNIIIRSC